MLFRFSLILSILFCEGFGQWNNEDSLLTKARCTHINRKTRSVPDYSCESFGTCKANKNFSFRTCYCDDYCNHFGDCCLDANITDKTSNLPDKFQYLSCVKLNLHTSFHKDSNLGVQMVSNCRKSITSTELVKKCEEDLNNSIPVTDKNGLTYKNKYCALCHGVVDYSFWSSIFMLRTCGRKFDYASMSEKNMAKRIDILQEHGCQMSHIPHNPYEGNIQGKRVFPRFCVKEVKADFINNNNREKCRKFLNPAFIIGTNIYVRNVFCLNFNSTRNDRHCLSPNHWYEDIMSLHHDARPMTALFQFKNYDQKNGDQVCPYNYKGTKEVCGNSPSCNITYSNPCIKESVDSYRFVIKLSLESDQLYMNTFERAMIMFFMSLPINYYQLKLMEFRIYVSCKESERRRCCFFGYFPIVIQRNIIHDELAKFTTAVQNMKYIYQENLQNKSSIVNRKTKNENFTCGKDVIIESFFVSTKTIKMYMENIHMETIGTTYPDVPESSEVKVLIGDEFDLRGVASSIKVISMKHSFPIQTNSALSKLSLVNIQVIITYSTMGLSSLSLAFAICLFVYFKLYNNFGDQICINIMCTLILTNVIFMCGIGFVDNSNVCYIIGVVLHFLWLCVFTWVSLFTIVFTVTLWKMEMHPTFNPDKIWSKRPLYFSGYGIPAMIAASCIVFETVWLDFHMDYNGNVCFPTGFPENIVFFTAPVVFSITVNVLLLILASKLLKKQFLDSLTQPSQALSVYIATIIKLCLFSGVFWIFGVLSQALENDILAFIFIICCGSQGLVFAVCFVTSSRIRRKCFEFMSSSNSNNTSQELVA